MTYIQRIWKYDNLMMTLMWIINCTDFTHTYLKSDMTLICFLIYLIVEFQTILLGYGFKYCWPVPAIEATAVACNPMKSILPCLRTAHVLPWCKYNHTTWPFAIQCVPENMHIILLSAVFVLLIMAFLFNTMTYFQIFFQGCFTGSGGVVYVYSADQIILKNMGMVYQYLRTKENTINNWS